MNPTAVAGFQSLMLETVDRQGWHIPKPVVDYTVRILAAHVDRNPWQPEPSYAERWLTIRTAAEAQAFGDVCWFTRAVFPDLMQRRGISSNYYVQLGEGSYDRVLRSTQDPTIQCMRDHFEFIAEVAWTAVHSQGGFRSMWE